MPLQESEKLLAIIRDAEEFSSECIGTNEYEPKFMAILEFIKKHPDLRPKIVEEFSKKLRDRDYGHYQLIEFCMHKLKWPEMRLETEAIYNIFKEEVIRKNLHGNASQHLYKLENVLSSFEDSWENKDLFNYYTTP